MVKELKFYNDYLFARTGVKEGDELLSFAHRPIINLRSIPRVLLDVSLDTEVLLTVKRNNDELNMTLLVE